MKVFIWDDHAHSEDCGDCGQFCSENDLSSETDEFPSGATVEEIALIFADDCDHSGLPSDPVVNVRIEGEPTIHRFKIHRHYTLTRDPS